nr:hypothetical protein [Tanacetum cinerariifolium]
ILGDKIICDLDKTPDLSQRSPQNCPKILQDSFGPSNDNSNVANALRDPFVVNLDPGNNSSQIPPQIRIDETDCYHEEETHFIKRLLYDNSSPRLPEEFVAANSDTEIKSFSPSPSLHLLSRLRIMTLLWKKLIYPLL